MPMPHTRTDAAAATPRVPSAPQLTLNWQLEGERLTCRWIATPADEPGVPFQLAHVA